MQRITVEQLQELTEEQRERLREWWKPEAGDTVKYIYDTDISIITSHVNDFNMVLIKGNYRIRTAKGDCTPLLSIGQLIQLLQDKVAYFSMTNMYAGTSEKLCWGVYKPKLFDIRADELIIALFQACKAVL